ncbi:MAG: hypothetical protein HKO87_03875 [Acidimicrobiia bacterium]|nr:hypothetical protein [Acidimicrobiia bacterium]
MGSADGATVSGLHDRVVRCRPAHGSVRGICDRSAPSAAAEVYRQCLARNRETLFARFALDPDGDLVLCGRVPNDLVTPIVIDTVIGEVYQLVEVAFRPMVRAMGREKNA